MRVRERQGRGWCRWGVRNSGREHRSFLHQGNEGNEEDMARVRVFLLQANEVTERTAHAQSLLQGAASASAGRETPAEKPDQNRTEIGPKSVQNRSKIGMKSV